MIADFKPSRLSRIANELWIFTNRGKLIDLVPRPNSRTRPDNHMGSNISASTDLNVGFNYRERPYGNVGSQVSVLVDYRLRIDHSIGLWVKSTSAEHTVWPSTVIFPEHFQSALR